MAETLTYGYHNQDGVDVRVARIFNTYGKSIPCRSVNSLLIPFRRAAQYVLDLATVKFSLT